MSTRLGPAKAKGQRGSWFATVEGESLPCVHKFWTKGIWPIHHDQFKRHDGGISSQITGLVEAVRTGKRVILTDDIPTVDAAGNVTKFERTGYIAIYTVDDVSYSVEDGLRFRLTDRLRELK